MSHGHPAFHRTSAAVNNLALVPACLLPYRARWQALANALPSGSILVCIPSVDTPCGRVWEQIVAGIRAMGHPVVVMPIEQICGVDVLI